MRGDLLAAIGARYNQLTKVEKKVADMVLGSPEKVLFLSLKELAELCQVSNTTVFRFCKRMDLNGYQEFKMRLSLNYHDVKLRRERLGGSGNQINSLADESEKILGVDIGVMKKTVALLDEADVDKTVSFLYHAERICFFGLGNSKLTAMSAAYRFQKIKDRVCCAEDSHMQIMMAATMQENDVAVVFFTAEIESDLMQVAKLAKMSGAKLVCIVGDIESRLTLLADAVLLGRSFKGFGLHEGMTEEISHIILIELLCIEYKRRYYTEGIKSFTQAGTGE